MMARMPTQEQIAAAAAQVTSAIRIRNANIAQANEILVRLLRQHAGTQVARVESGKKEIL